MTIRLSRAFSCFFCLFFLSVSTLSFAQTGSISPYSRYGLGDIVPEGFTHQTGMAGMGVALSSPFNINVINPASYVADSIIVFEFGAFGELRKLERKSQSTNQSSGSFSHFSLAFPIVKSKLSLAFGLLPYSSVGYDIEVDQENVPDIGTVRYKYEGDGGYNKFFLGAGGRISKHLSAGINASYLFGTISHIKSVEFPQSDNYFNSRYVDARTAKGVYLNYGLLYETDLPKGLKLAAGIAGSASSRVRAEHNEYYFNYVYSIFTGGEILKDSVINTTSERGNIHLPDYYRGGFTIGKPMKWTAGADFSYLRWENYRGFNTIDSLKDSYTLRVGGERNTEKLIYRLGFRYGQSFLELNNSRLNEYGITFGFGLNKLFPKRPPSTINIAIEAGQRGTVNNNLIREQYLKVHLGFTLTDIWFFKPKYD